MRLELTIKNVQGKRRKEYGGAIDEQRVKVTDAKTTTLTMCGDNPEKLERSSQQKIIEILI